MIDWLPAATALAAAVSVVGEAFIKETASAGVKPAVRETLRRFLGDYQAEPHKQKLRAALQKTEAAFGKSADISKIQADFVATKIHALAANPRLAEQVLETLLVLDRNAPALVSDDLLNAFGLPHHLRPALAAFLLHLRQQFAGIPTYQPLLAYADQQVVKDLMRRSTAGIERLAGVVKNGAVTVRIAESTADLSAVKRDYLEYLAQAYRRLRFQGILQTKNPVELPLADVFVSLRVAPVGAEERKEMLDERAALQAAEREKRLGVEDVLRDHQGLVVLGDPGAGKTTLLRYVTLALAEGLAVTRERLGLRGEWLPMLLPLGAYAEELRQRDISLEDYLPRYWAARSFDEAGMKHLLKSELDAGRVLLLLDGLDEVGTRAERLTVTDRIAKWVAAYQRKGNRIIVTSRVIGYWEAPLPADLRTFTLNDFGPEEIQRFAHQWCVAYERFWTQSQEPAALAQAEAKGHSEADRLVEEISADANVLRLASNPLLMTAIALIHYKGTRLPHHRVQLYNLCTQTLVETWSEARSETGRRVGAPIRTEEEVKILAPLALWLQEQAPGPGGAARRERVREKLVETLLPRRKGDREAAEQDVDAFLQREQRQTGLLVERGEGWFGFYHPTFKEYLAAVALVLRGGLHIDDTWRELRKHLYDANWNEVILLTVGHLAVVESKESAASYLVRAILDDSAPTSSVGQNAVLAGRCLVDVGESGVSPDVWEEVRRRLQWTMQDTDEKGGPNHPPLIPLHTRAAAGETLDALGWLPPDLYDWIEIPEGETIFNDSRVRVPKFYIAKYPVTVAQYQEFIDAKGYARQEFWQNQRGVDEKGGEKNLDNEAWDWLQSHGGAERRPWYWDDPRFHRAGYPVIGVTWYEASAYCAWLAEQFQVAGFKFQVERKGQLETLKLETLTARLPTEAEWVRAAGGEEHERYPWDPENQSAIRNSQSAIQDVLAHANVKESEIGGTTPVAMYPDGASQPFGVWDLAGNVWEWTSTLYETKDWNAAWMRGGSWANDSKASRVSARYDWYRHNDYLDNGFRVFAR